MLKESEKRHEWMRLMRRLRKRHERTGLMWRHGREDHRRGHGRSLSVRNFLKEPGTKGVVVLLTIIVVVEPTILAAWADVFIISSPTIFVGHVGF